MWVDAGRLEGALTFRNHNPVQRLPIPLSVVAQVCEGRGVALVWSTEIRVITPIDVLPNETLFQILQEVADPLDSNSII